MHCSSALRALQRHTLRAPRMRSGAPSALHAAAPNSDGAAAVAVSTSSPAAAGADSKLLPPELSEFRPNVGMCVVNSRGQVFAARRLDDPIPDSWQMPQGGIDDGESPRDAAVRELFEEVSMRSVEIVGEIDEWLPYEFPTDVRCRLTGSWARFKGQAQRWYLFAFRGDDSEINLETEHREFRDWQWMDLAELPPKVIPFKRGVYERVSSEFGPAIARLRESGALGSRST